MVVNEIFVSSRFKKQFSQLPKLIQKKALKAEALFRKNPFHPSLRLHKLRGKFDEVWTLSINMKYRIVFKSKGEGEIVFASIGLHSVYEENL